MLRSTNDTGLNLVLGARHIDFLFEIDSNALSHLVPALEFGQSTVFLVGGHRSGPILCGLLVLLCCLGALPLLHPSRLCHVTLAFLSLAITLDL